MATLTTRLGLRRIGPGDPFKPASVDLPAIVDTLDTRVVQFNAPTSQVQVRDVGESGQIRAGRQLAVADFTAMGLSTPVGLWNLGDTSNLGTGGALTNKGTVPFAPGIGGAANTAAQFAGSTAQALYIADTGAADPFRLGTQTGTFGCWARTAKRGTGQYLLSKFGSAGTPAVQWWSLSIATGNVASFGFGNFSFSATTDIADDRWHFVVVTMDGTTNRLYVDGALDGQGKQSGPTLPTTAAPLNIGGFGADGATAAVNPHYGRVDEAFVTADILSPEQVLNLYCARITHALQNGAGAAVAPTGARIAVRRRKRGGPLVAGDFPATPVRLHNFTAGSLSDDGSGGVTLTSNPGTGAIVSVSGADGANGGAYSFSGAHTGLSSTDAGLPSGTAARSYGCWLKTPGIVSAGVLGWGTLSTADARLWTNTDGTLRGSSGADTIVGPYCTDSLWHHIVVVEDNAAGDGVKRKLYYDGRNVGGSTVLNTLTLAGANRFRVGAVQDGTSPLVGQIDGVFVYSGALTDTQVRAIYNKGSQALAASPKAEGDHVEALEATGVLAHFDSLESCDLVDLSVVG